MNVDNYYITFNSFKNLFDQGIKLNLITYQELVFATCQVARSVVHIDKTGKAVFAIEAAELWCKNPTTKNANAAYTAATATYAADAANAAAADAAYAAAFAADAANAAANATVAANAAAASAADAGYAAGYANAAANYAVNVAANAAYAVAYAAAAVANATDNNIDIKKIIMLHLPKLNKLKAFL